ncbi:MAG: periplasmic heavy metal sensor [bacterium]
MKQTLVVSVLGLVLAGALLAQPGHGMKMGMHTGMDSRGCHQKMMKDHSCQFLDLNDEQKEKINNLRTDFLKDVKPIKDKLAEKQVKLNTLRTAEKVNMKSVNSLIEEIVGLKADLINKQEAHHQQIRSLLTEEQRIHFDNQHKRMHCQGKHHMQKGVKHNCGNYCMNMHSQVKHHMQMSGKKSCGNCDTKEDKK